MQSDNSLTYVGSQLMGLPHIGSVYTKGWAGKRKRYERISDVCEVCRQARAESTHHIVPVGMGGRQSGTSLYVDPLYCHKYDAKFVQLPEFIATGMGSFEVYTPLIAVCGDGARGCHGEFEARTLVASWIWDDELCRELWDKGWMLSHGYKPNSERLFEFGHYELRRNGEVVREVYS